MKFRRRGNTYLEETQGQDKARKLVLGAANNFLATTDSGRVLTRRHIQEAVCIVRRRLLLSDDTLRQAGYRGVTVRPARRLEPWGGRGGYNGGDNLQSDFVGRPRAKKVKK